MNSKKMFNIFITDWIFQKFLRKKVLKKKKRIHYKNRDLKYLDWLWFL